MTVRMRRVQEVMLCRPIIVGCNVGKATLSRAVYVGVQHVQLSRTKSGTIRNKFRTNESGLRLEKVMD